MNYNNLKALLGALLISAAILASTLAKANNEQEANELLALAKNSLGSKQLDKAEAYVEKLLQIDPNDPEHFFIAGRIAGAQAQEANIFSKLGYARDAKKYFERALSIDPKHQASIIGLIRFHEQASVMAGGEKESIPELIDQLREVDKRAAFSYERVKLLDKGELELLEKRYQTALKSESSGNTEQFKYDYAMSLSNYGHFSKALDTILSVDLSNPDLIAEFAAMRLYQLAKLAAESRRELDLGIESIQQYAKLSAEDKTIPEDWVEFRLIQLQFLNGDKAISKETFKQLKSSTKEKSLKAKISSFLNEVKQ